MDNKLLSVELLKKEITQPEHLQQTSEIVKLIRVSLGYTQQEFGVLLNTQSTTVSRWETGRNQPVFTQEQIEILNTKLKKIGVNIFDWKKFEVKLSASQYQTTRHPSLNLAIA